MNILWSIPTQKHSGSWLVLLIVSRRIYPVFLPMYHDVAGQSVFPQPKGLLSILITSGHVKNYFYRFKFTAPHTPALLHVITTISITPQVSQNFFYIFLIKVFFYSYRTEAVL